jgi:hypothetical protein
MSKAQEIARLQSLAALVLDKKLADLRVLATAKNETQARLADLATAEIFMQSGGDVADVVAALAYQGWADTRRAEINQTLARQTAAWLDARDLARTAFGKADVLDALSQQIRKFRAH